MQVQSDWNNEINLIGLCHWCYDKSCFFAYLLSILYIRILIMVNYIQPRIPLGQISKPPPGFQASLYFIRYKNVIDLLTSSSLLMNYGWVFEHIVWCDHFCKMIVRCYNIDNWVIILHVTQARDSICLVIFEVFEKFTCACFFPNCTIMLLPIHIFIFKVIRRP